MKFISNLGFIFSSIILVSFCINPRNAAPSCGYGTFFDGYTCQECGLASSQPSKFRIVGGVDAVKNSLPSEVYLKIYENGGSSVCGGTLISKRTVLTAAHCVYGVPPSRIHVYVGAYDISKIDWSVIITTSTKTVIHNLYVPGTYTSDIALIHLARSVNLGTNIGVACLPQSQTTAYPPPNTAVIAAGWGATSEYSSPSNILQNVGLNVFDTSSTICNRAIEDSRFQFCAGYKQGGKDACFGDSGGGLLRLETINGKTRQVVAGITSYGAGCGRPGLPGVYIRASIYLDWIKANSIY